MDKKKIVNSVLSKILSYIVTQYEKNKIKDKRRVNLYSQIELTNEQKLEINNFYLTNYGKKIPYKWHRLYQSFTGKFDVTYFPEFLYIPNFEAKMNPYWYSKAFEDKNLLEFLVKNTEIKIPEVIISCVNGVLRNKDCDIIDISKSVEILKKQKENLFLKPSIDSSSGIGCTLIDITTMKLDHNFMSNIIKKYSGNFVLQKKIENSKELRALHPDSVNTFRIMTYIWSGKIEHCPVVLRMGKNQITVDNAHAGGIFIGVKDDGNLCEEAYTEFQERYLKHPDTDILFKGYTISKVKDVITAAKKLHSQIPQLGIVSWDLTLDKNDDIVLIEANIRGGSIWLPQMAHGCGVFGKNTASILRYISRKDIVSKEIY